MDTATYSNPFARHARPPHTWGKVRAIPKPNFQVPPKQPDGQSLPSKPPRPKMRAFHGKKEIGIERFEPKTQKRIQKTRAKTEFHHISLDTNMRFAQ
jgi:hypothetical protein